MSADDFPGRDAPGLSEAYVIRIETGRGLRLKTVINDSEVEDSSPEERLELIQSKAVGVAVMLLGSEGHKVHGSTMFIRNGQGDLEEVP